MTNPRLSVHILADQLLDAHPALEAAEAQTPREQIRVVLVESTARLKQRPYHKQKLVLLLSALRHYAERLRERGYTVEHIRADTMTGALRQHVEAHQPDRLLTMAAAEYAPRQFQRQRLADALGVTVDVLPNTQFLVGQHNPYPQPDDDKSYIMEYFYREMRRHFGVLMDDKRTPAGGQWNYDKLNREPLPREEQPPPVRTFTADAITQAVIEEIEREGYGVGEMQDFGYAVTHEDAAAAFDDFLTYRLAKFGPYEDAMSAEHPILYHARVSPYLNIGLLEPLPLVRAAEAAYREGRAPLNSVEGFVRQIIGWREFMYWQYWRQMPGLRKANGWGARRSMPAFFWDGDTRMNCLHHVIEKVVATGYSHHIERLMVVSNFCLLAGIDPQAVVEWFVAFYIDAYDWVMQPNVVGMGLNADDGRTATKPYIASANYIDKMSDYCEGCYFDRKKRTGERACPYNTLYWNFLITHEERLRANPRLGPNVLGLKYLKDGERDVIRAQAAEFLDSLPYYGRIADGQSGESPVS